VRDTAVADAAVIVFDIALVIETAAGESTATYFDTLFTIDTDDAQLTESVTRNTFMLVIVAVLPADAASMRPTRFRMLASEPELADIVMRGCFVIDGDDPADAVSDCNTVFTYVIVGDDALEALIVLTMLLTIETADAEDRDRILPTLRTMDAEEAVDDDRIVFTCLTIEGDEAVEASSDWLYV